MGKSRMASKLINSTQLPSSGSTLESRLRRKKWIRSLKLKKSGNPEVKYRITVAWHQFFEGKCHARSSWITKETDMML